MILKFWNYELGLRIEYKAIFSFFEKKAVILQQFSENQQISIQK